MIEISELQKDLAATFRWTARLNMHEGVANHFSACVPGSSTDFYINKAGIHFSQIKASDLILVTKENMEELKKKPEIVDPTAINIHGTIHKKVPHAKCIFHVHSKYATVLSTLKNPTLKPIDQNTMIFFNRVSVFNEFGGLGFEEESIKMASALGNKQHMLLANHGIITTGKNIAEGFNALYYFEKAAETYLTALSTNKELNIVSNEIAEKTAQETTDYPIDLAKMHLDQIKSILDKEESDYKR
jgi:ribulose-5-phosphate 4-epimerase/fuculose-1-phosphate aldolase